ncbi:MFS transporter [Rhodopila sp.]|uniref:MFS transporter n=1 Tax=Rhodopila sp. TaxID=2480087 RepID=UPI002C4417E1|nr:MFS transporter [Rhodopila sp.]HVZ10188.1 MFS transporter [Rhodopila sp.]
MIGPRLAKACSHRFHYAWITLVVVFCAMLAGVGVRAAPGVMITPLEKAFGWDVSTISAAISINIILLGATGPFLTGLMQVIGLKRTMLGCFVILMTGTGLSYFMHAPWQLFLTWGFMVGIGSGAGAVGFAGAVANRWFAQRAGLAMGLLTSANAAGQLIFLPILALLVDRYGWQGVSLGLTVTIAAVIPMVMVLLPESPAAIGIPAYGATTVAAPQMSSGSNPFSVAFTCLARASRSMDFWLLCLTFGICGLSTNGLINTHLIPYCSDMGIPQLQGASILAVIGMFSLIGSTASGWLCDRYSPRILLFWYYSLRGLSLVLIPFSNFDAVSLSVFSVFYGLDWVATGPATFALTNEVFGRRDAPVIVSWIFAAHQIGGAIAAFGGGAIRSLSGSYMMAFVASGAACLMASLLVMRITPRGKLVTAIAE